MLAANSLKKLTGADHDARVWIFHFVAMAKAKTIKVEGGVKDLLLSDKVLYVSEGFEVKQIT